MNISITQLFKGLIPLVGLSHGHIRNNPLMAGHHVFIGIDNGFYDELDSKKVFDMRCCKTDHGPVKRAYRRKLEHYQKTYPGNSHEWSLDPFDLPIKFTVQIPEHRLEMVQTCIQEMKIRSGSKKMADLMDNIIVNRGDVHKEDVENLAQGSKCLIL